MTQMSLSLRFHTALRLGIFLALALFALAPRASAQGGGNVAIAGTVTDPQGALVLLCHKRQTPQNGQRQSWRSRERARMMRKVAMECGLCRSGRMRASGLEVGRELGN